MVTADGKGVPMRRTLAARLKAESAGARREKAAGILEGTGMTERRQRLCGRDALLRPR